MGTAVHEPGHDHGPLTERVVALASLARNLDRSDGSALVTASADLRVRLFEHVAREEEQLFPFVAVTFDDLAVGVHELEIAHDRMCGALSLLCDAAVSRHNPLRVALLFDRFDHVYREHLHAEAELLRLAVARVEPELRARLLQLAAEL